MKEATRAAIWSAVNESFLSIHRSLQPSVPGVKLAVGSSCNDSFAFRSFATYSSRSESVDISIDIQHRGDHLVVFGDISLSSGLVIADLGEIAVDAQADEPAQVAVANQFGDKCQGYLKLIAEKLGPSEHSM